MRCFVIQGFGKKTDYQQGKVFDLDASYRVIKRGIQRAGIDCYRGDEIVTAGLIDQPLYDELLTADLVLADISTLNFNAAYELGVRMALRPHATLVIGEEGINFPFDINHVKIHTYRHLGEDIGSQEAERLIKELGDLARQVLARQGRQSPVYKFLPSLPDEGCGAALRSTPTHGVRSPGDATVKDLKDLAEALMQAGRYVEAVAAFERVLEHTRKDDYITQQLALATYRSRLPDPEQALLNAREILSALQPDASFDPETLGLWASVHKRLFDLTGEEADLEAALQALERGFFSQRDYYNGINLAFMLDRKAVIRSEPERAELRTMARYVRRKVKTICIARLEEEQPAETLYWLRATLYEACVGLEEAEEAEVWKQRTLETPHQADMWESTREQVSRLEALLRA